MKNPTTVAIDKAKRALIEALHHLNTYPAPSSRDLGVAILWVGLSTIHLREADPNEEALDIADQIFAKLPKQQEAT